MEFLQHYGLFLAKTITVLIAVLVAAAALSGLGSWTRGGTRERLLVTPLNRPDDSQLSR